MVKAESQISVPISLDASHLADWGESTMFVEKRKYLSRSELRRRLRSALSVEAEDIDI